jgi:hypothetical protein
MGFPFFAYAIKGTLAVGGDFDFISKRLPKDPDPAPNHVEGLIWSAYRGYITSPDVPKDRAIHQISREAFWPYFGRTHEGRKSGKITRASIPGAFGAEWRDGLKRSLGGSKTGKGFGIALCYLEGLDGAV